MMEEDELLMEFHVDGFKLCSALCWRDASNVSGRACPVSGQLAFRPEGLQLRWLSGQPAS